MKLIIDDRPVEVDQGATGLDAVNRLGVVLPQRCEDADRSPLGACRTSLVHVEGTRGTPAACHLPAGAGMIVSTSHPDAARSYARRPFSGSRLVRGMGIKLADSATNFLTNSAHDPSSKIPEYKVCAVRIDPIRAGMRG